MKTSKKTRCFFSDTPLLGEGQIVFLLSDETRHAQTTLRLTVGSEIRVTDGQGREGLAVVEAYETDSRTKLRLLKLLRDITAKDKGKPQVRLFVAFAAKGVMDELVEKAQELGVSHFYPLKTEYTVISLSAEKETKVLDRWYKITREAAKQSGNSNLTQVFGPLGIHDALEKLNAGDEAAFLHPDPQSTKFSEWFQQGPLKSSECKSINLFVGPEGGFSEQELEAACEKSKALGIQMTKIFLGDNILRVSTAVVGAVAAIKLMQ